MSSETLRACSTPAKMSIRPLHGHKYDPTGIYTRMDNEQLDEDLALRENLYANHRQTEKDMVTSSLAKNVELQIEKAKPSSVVEAKAIAPQFASWIHESEAIHPPSPANCSVVPFQHWTTLEVFHQHDTHILRNITTKTQVSTFKSGIFF